VRAAVRIDGQSSTAARTSSSTRCRDDVSAAISAWSVSRSISMCIQDSTRASAGRDGSVSPAATMDDDVSRISSRLPSSSLRTTNTGWITRWIPRPWRVSSAVTESTRKGMSSLTISTTVWPVLQPCSSTVGRYTRTLAVRSARRAASWWWHTPQPAMSAGSQARRSSSATSRKYRDRKSRRSSAGRWWRSTASTAASMASARDSSTGGSMARFDLRRRYR
jgi:hypothetical protein